LYCYSTVLCFTANVTLLLLLNDEFDGIWASCVAYSVDSGAVMVALVFMTIQILWPKLKMVWSQGGHI